MEYMKDIPDKHFDLAIVDPPYGLGIDGQKKTSNKNPRHNRKLHVKRNWDNEIPPVEYFELLKSKSINQIIFGANYFIKHLHEPTKGWVFWFKGQTGLRMSDGEIIYTSFNVPTRQVTINRFALYHEGTIHPTQKPIILYKWLLEKYAKPGQKILDSHLGSASSAIAAHQLGLNFVGCELDKYYYDLALERFNCEIK